LKNLFVLNTPLQYFMARLIMKTYYPEDSAILRYRDAHDYGDGYKRIDDAIGPINFAVNEYDEKASSRLAKVQRLFICDRFNPTQVRLSWQISHNKLCAFEDGLAFYMQGHHYSKNWNDNNLIFISKNLIKHLLQFAGIETRYKPSHFPFRRFDEIYSVFPRRSEQRRIVPHYSLANALSSIVRPEGNEGQGTALVLSQSLVTDGAANIDVYADYIKDRLEELSSRYKQVYFKPHPRDSKNVVSKLLESEAVTLLPTEYQSAPVELYLAKNPKTSLYGFTSSTLAYANLLGVASCSFARDFETRTKTIAEFNTLLAKAAPLLEAAHVTWYKSN
jgi:hypothetical protein